jgi:hypothetical protein
LLPCSAHERRRKAFADFFGLGVDFMLILDKLIHISSVPAVLPS